MRREKERKHKHENMEGSRESTINSKRLVGMKGRVRALYGTVQQRTVQLLSSHNTLSNMCMRNIYVSAMLHFLVVFTFIIH